MGSKMILPDLILSTRSNQQWFDSGMDSLEYCRNKKHFQEYPYQVVYDYNSRGFRDAEWPLHTADLQKCIWCVGDSFTVGNGQPLEHTWPRVMQNITGRRCINVSMDGASNDWIFRRSVDIMSYVKPQHIVIMWSYSHRRENPNTDLTDEDRRLWCSQCSCVQDTYHWIDLANRIHKVYPSIIQTTIPGFDYLINDHLRQHWNDVKAESWPDCPNTYSDLARLPLNIEQELKFLHGCYDTMAKTLKEVGNYNETVYAARSAVKSNIVHIGKNIDWARDYHHFDILTARWLVNQILPRLD